MHGWTGSVVRGSDLERHTDRQTDRQTETRDRQPASQPETEKLTDGERERDAEGGSGNRICDTD